MGMTSANDTRLFVGLCGAVDPDRPGIVDHEPGEKISDPVTCTGYAGIDPVTGKFIAHKGKHRRRLLTGQLERWDNKQTPAETRRQSLREVIQSRRASKAAAGASR